MEILNLIFIFASFNLSAGILIDEVQVFKSKHEMQLLYHGQLVKKYTVMLGSGGSGPKRQDGDRLVPEGQYILDEKNPESLYHRSIHISYPNQKDKERAEKEGVEPGKDVFIHGLPNTKSHAIEILRDQLVKIKDTNKIKVIQKKLDWTKGCIAVSDKEIEEIYNNLLTPTPITIYP